MKRPEADEEEVKTWTRLGRMRRDRREAGEDDWETYEPERPPCDALFLVRYLFDVGPILPTAMGATVVTEEELGWWQFNTGVTLEPWQSRFIKRLSAEFLRENALAKKETRPAPWVSEYEKSLEEKLKVAAKIRALFR